MEWPEGMGPSARPNHARRPVLASINSPAGVARNHSPGNRESHSGDFGVTSGEGSGWLRPASRCASRESMKGTTYREFAPPATERRLLIAEDIMNALMHALGYERSRAGVGHTFGCRVVSGGRIVG